MAYHPRLSAVRAPGQRFVPRPAPPFPPPNPFPEHNLTGDVLVLLDQDSLKEIGIATIGQRLAILKAVYNVKLAQNIPIKRDDYVPPCASFRVPPLLVLTCSVSRG